MPPGGGLLLPLSAEPSKVNIDIKPGSCPNPLNTKNRGVLPVAILGSDDVDVDDVDPSTVYLEGASPLKWDVEDVSTHVTDNLDDCDCTTQGPDGFDGLLFLTREFGAVTSHLRLPVVN